MDLSNTIIPKSDQMNADDLIGGPRTVRITEVKGGTPEQPVSIHYEGDSGRPYKPGKSMRRILVAMWGPKTGPYIGKRITLYRAPEVAFGGQKVGGIRISHADGIELPFEIALTEKRGSRKPHRVEPLPPEKQDPDLPLLIASGDAAAKLGQDGLKAWWTALPASALKLQLANSHLPAWKEAASKNA